MAEVARDDHPPISWHSQLRESELGEGLVTKVMCVYVRTHTCVMCVYVRVCARCVCIFACCVRTCVQEGSGSDLIILSASLEEAGVYRCWAANVAGQVSQDVTLNVIGGCGFRWVWQTVVTPPPVAPPVTSIEPGDVVAHVGCQVVFTCLDGGAPPGDFVWVFDGVAVELMDGDVVVRDNGELVLSNLQLQDAGNYSCTVSGMFQNITSVVTLTVQDPLFPDTSGSYLTSPFIISPTPSTLLVSVADTAQFVCVVEGNPPPEVVWLVDGVEVNSSRVEILMDVVFVVGDVTASDAGMYTCRATNSRGDSSRDFTLVVTGE